MNREEISKAERRRRDRIGILIILLVAALTMAFVNQQQITGQQIQYRGGSQLTFDTSVTFQDEQNAWQFGWTHMRRLAQLRSGVTNNVTSLTVTNTFPLTYPTVPQVFVSANTNASVISVTTSNAVFWAAATNVNTSWLATSP